MKWDRWKGLSIAYVFAMAFVMLGYVRYDPYQIDGDAVSYMDLATAILHKRWHEIVNGLWNPAYPALLAFGKLLTHAGRMHELQVFYWVNFFIFLTCIVCTAFFVKSIVRLRSSETREAPSKTLWMLPDELFYLASYAVVCLSWLHEFSPGKIRVDGLFASLLLLGFGCLLRITYSSSVRSAIGAGISFGLAYLVKSPGFTIALLAFFLFAVYLFLEAKLKGKAGKLLIAIAISAAIAAPYIVALSLQKGRFDIGDSARLNYAWYVSGTEPLHLLNNQPGRFGNADIHLKHPQIEKMSDPIVVSFAQFPNATYGPWFDPSYFNEGVVPRFNLMLQLRLLLNQSRHLLLFLDSHALVLAFFIFSVACGARIEKVDSLRRILFLLYIVLVFCFLMYLSVHFLDRYVGGMFWLASIATLGLFTMQNEAKRNMVQGAVIFMAIAILLLGAQSIMQMRQGAIFSGVHYGWQRTEEFGAAKKLNEAGVLPGNSVSCFRACSTGSYWARLAGVHVTSEIFDPRYMPDSDGNLVWRRLPNHAALLHTLADTGAKALVGYFEQPPAAIENWKPLAGHFYWLSLSNTGQSSLRTGISPDEHIAGQGD